ncbi:MAG TPA: AAA family ATPase, partial [Dehalococcoidia bacterium]|nr:AAA family ATPase [Dehalococcoidia bacterium]
MSQELPEGTVTVLFTDVEGSTALANSRGDEVAQGILRAQRDLVRAQLREHGGYEVKSLGDGFMVAFGSARRAIACATAIQQAIAAHNGNLPIEEQVQVRIGINAGDVIREEQDLFGSTVNAAARIAAKAAGSQIFVSETVKSLLGSAKEVRFVDRGRYRLKGFDGRWRLHEIIWQEEGDGVRPPAVQERTPFVCREGERQQLRQLLERTAAGAGGLVLVRGEAGIGKSRLCEEAAAEASERGVLTVTGHCYEMEGGPPYLPFAEALEAMARSLAPETLKAALAGRGPEVAKIVPDVRRMLPDIGSPVELPPEHERLYLFNSIRDFLAAATSAAPVMVVAEDLQWADDSTLLLLQYLAQHLPSMRLLVIATYRDAEVEAGRPLARAIEELNRQRLARTISLKRFDEAGLGSMLLALSGHAPPPPLVRVIYRETEGNPFFAEELFTHLSDEGALFDLEGRWRENLEVGETDVPESLKLVLSRRLQRVGENCQRMLTAAAVIGRAFAFELLDAVSEMGTETLLDALDEAERAHLVISSTDDSVAAFRFNHELIRQTLLSQVSAARRQRLHLKVAEEIERLEESLQQRHAPDVAYHLSQAGAAAEGRKTAHYLGLAGNRALEGAAFEDALRLFEQALQMTPSGERQARAELAHKRGLALRGTGRWDQAMKAWRESIALYRSLGDTEAPARIYASVCQQLMWARRFLEALELSNEGLSRLKKTPTGERATLMGIAGLTVGLAGFRDPAAKMLDEALATAQEVGDQHILGRTFMYRAMFFFAFPRLEEELESSMRAVELLRATGDLWELCNAMWLRQIGLIGLGRLEDGKRLAEELIPLADRLGHLGAKSLVSRGAAIVRLMQTGDIAAFLESAREEAKLQGEEVSTLAPGGTATLGFAHFWRGDWAEARRLMDDALDNEGPGVLTGLDAAGALILRA